MDSTTKKLLILGIVGSLIIIGGIVAIVLILKKEADGGNDNGNGDGGNGGGNGNGDGGGNGNGDGGGNGNGDGGGNGNGDGDEEVFKYNIISPYQNPEQVDVPNDAGGIDDCAAEFEENDERQEGEAIGFAWNTFSNYKEYKDPDFRPPACTIRSDATVVPNTTDTNSFLFELDPEGIDLNQWNVHLGVGSRDIEAREETVSDVSLGECADIIANEYGNFYTSFIYNFEQHGCYGIGENDNIRPTYPWGEGEGGGFPGAYFTPKQLEVDFVSTTGRCTEMGMDYIMDKDECVEAATSLNIELYDPNLREAKAADGSNRPKGCYWSTSTNEDQRGLWMATTATAKHDCTTLEGTQLRTEHLSPNTSTRFQICKKKIKR